MSLASTIECPYCTSPVTITSHDDGHLEVRHHDDYGPECETRLWHLTADHAKANGLNLLRRN